MFGGLKRSASASGAGVGIVLKVGADGGLYVKSMQKEGPAWSSNVVRVGDLLLEVDGRDAFKPDKVKKMVVGPQGTGCELLLKRWACNGEDSVIYSTTLVRKLIPEEAKDADSNARAAEPGSSEGLALSPTARASAVRSAVQAPVTPPRQDARGRTMKAIGSPLSLLKQQTANTSWKGGNGGIGIVFKSKEDAMVVKSMIPSGSAARSNLVQVGDVLSAIDGKKMLGKPVDKVVRRVLGAVGSIAEVQFQRRANSLTGEPCAIYTVMLTRGVTAEIEEATPVVSPPTSANARALAMTVNSTLLVADAPEDSTDLYPDVHSRKIHAAKSMLQDSPREAPRKTISVIQHGPHTAEKTSCVQGPTSSSAHEPAPLDGQSSTNSSPTEHALRGRCERVLPASEGPVLLTLALARALSDLVDQDQFKRELLSELAQALFVPCSRFAVLDVRETITKSVIVDVQILPTGSGDCSELALEVQRQVADPGAPLREAEWFGYVTSTSATTNAQEISPPMSHSLFKAPLITSADADFGAPDFGAFGAPGFEGFDLPSLLLDCDSLGNVIESTSVVEALPSKKQLEETAINKLRREQPSPSLVASWLADVSSQDGSQTDSRHSGDLRRCQSLPDLHTADSRSALEAENRRLHCSLARKERERYTLHQELRMENDALRARVKALEASEQRHIAEAKILKGLSVSQAKELQAYQIQSRTLATQLRDEKKKGRGPDKKACALSEVFRLEQQLHAERARVAELSKALEFAKAATCNSPSPRGEDSPSDGIEASVEASPRLPDLDIASAPNQTHDEGHHNGSPGRPDFIAATLSPRKSEPLDTTTLSRVDFTVIRN